MDQVKLIKTRLYEDIEEKVNNWLKETPNIKIKNIVNISDMYTVAVLIHYQIIEHQFV